MRLFLDMENKTVFYPPHTCGHWHQNKWRVLLGSPAKQEMLPNIRAISGDFFIFQQDSAPTGP